MFDEQYDCFPYPNLLPMFMFMFMLLLLLSLLLLLLLLLLALLLLLTLAMMLAEKLKVMSRKDRKPKAEKLLPGPHVSPDLGAEMQKGTALCYFFQVVLIFAGKKETKKGYFCQARTHPKLRIPSLFVCGAIP